ncbi:MAG: lamin tail domain-containing protein [Prevotella sp.]|nr:lamin tail domain-containing protein [Prevotella sp.]
MISSARLLLSFLFLCFGVQWTVAQTSLQEGTWYLRNKSTSTYLNAGGLWGTQAVLSPHAIPLELKKSDDGNWLIYTGFSKENDGCLGLTADGLFLDCSRYPWGIEECSNGCFLLSTPDGGYVGINATGALTIMAYSDSEALQWQLLTHAQMLTELLGTTPAIPQDATFLISNPRFDRNREQGKWEGSSFSIGGEVGYGGNGNYCAEVWNGNFDVFQTLKHIPNGRYQLTIQGFYRYNNTNNNTNSVAVQTHRMGTEKLLAQLYANDMAVSLMSIVAERDNMRRLGLSGSNSDLPFSMTEASNAFTAQLYTANKLEVSVTNHELTIGIRKTQKDGCDWTVWDNVQLTLMETGDNSDYDVNSDGTDATEYDDVSPENPMDMTSHIVNPNFDSSSGWSGSPVIGGASGNPNAEKYNTTFDVYQTLHDIPNGWYRLKAQGFYRYGDYHDEQHKSYYGGGWTENDANNMYAMYTIPYAVISRKEGFEKHLAELYANHVAVGLPSPFDFAHESATHPDDYPTELGWVPDTQRGASGAFSDGEYPVELFVPVTDNTLRVGVRKSLGYKYDWACWDNFQLQYLGKQGLVYADGLLLNTQSLRMVPWQKYRLEGTVTPNDASDNTLSWHSNNTNVVEVDNNGMLTAKAVGTTTVTVTANGAEGNNVAATITVVVEEGTANINSLVINEIQVSNLDMFLDPSGNYGGYVELYNPANQGVSLRNLYVSDDPSNLLKCRLTSKSGAVPANGFALVWFDHRDTYDGQVDFKLDMDGGTIYLSDAGGNVIVSQAYPPVVSRTSYARTTDGSGPWAITAYPTPGVTNTNSREFLSAATAPRLAMPVVSHESQLFKGQLVVNVDIPDGATLRYTLDGATPTEDRGDMSADGLFTIDQTTTLRLRLFKQGMLPSPVKTCSYIYDDKGYMLPILSVIAAPEDFYDDEKGVFVTGTNGVTGAGINFKCNWNMDWERAVNFNYIAPDNAETYSQESSLSRFGGWSRSWYPYNFKLVAKKEYEGLNFVAHPFFGNKPYLKQKALQVRNGGNDLLCRIKDASLQQIIISSGFHLDCQDYLPIHSFINGKYQGMLNLREASNKHFAYANYGIDTDLMDQMELGGGIDVKVGTIDSFNKWRELSANATDDKTYREICDIVDIDEFANYMATQIFLGGDDWPGNNCKAFKGNDGKFHIVLFDIDQALRYDAYAFTHLMNNSGCPLVEIFLNMMKNDIFRKLFIDTYCLVGGSVFEPTRCKEIIDRMCDEMNPALALEGLSTEPTASYVKAVLTATRRNTMMDAISTWSPALIEASGQQVKLSSNVEEARLQVNGLDVPTGKFDGTLFAPIVVKALAPEGFVFKGWVNEQGNLQSSEEEYDISNLGMLTLVATFERLVDDEELSAAIAMPIKVNEVSAGNSVFINDWLKKSDWIELYNNTDVALDVAGLYVSDDIDEPQKYQIPDGNGVVNTIIPAGGHLVVWADKLESISQLHANFKLSNTEGSMVLVSGSDQFVNRNPDYFDQHPGMGAFIDGITYTIHRGDQSVGRHPDGGRFFYQMWRPTIEQTNTLLTADSLVGEDRNLMLKDNLFTLQLQSGWNWVSHNLSIPVGVEELSNQVQRVTSQTKEAIYDDVLGMAGSLKTMEAGSLYKVLMKTADTFTSTVEPCKSDMPITLRPGWNWIGYPVDGAQPVTAALADYPADEGDQLMGQDGFAVYENGIWAGTLSSMETGKGYMLHTDRAKVLRFAAPSVRLNINRAGMRGQRARDYGIDKHAHPNVMGVIASLTKDGEQVDADRFTVLAFSSGVCRGMGKQVGDNIFITIHGEGNEPLDFKALDNMEGVVYTIRETIPFMAGVEGAPSTPFLLTIGEETDGIVPLDGGELAKGIAGRTVEGYYNLSGVRCASRVGTLPSGMYLVKYSDGVSRKIYVK